MRHQALISVISAVLTIICTNTNAQSDPRTSIEIETKNNLDDDIFSGRIILNNASNSDVILDQIPGRLCVTYLDNEGTRVTKTFGERPLVKNTKLPSISIKSQNLRNSIIEADATAGVGFLSFVSVKGLDAQYINYRVDRTATVKVDDLQIDWGKARAMVKQLEDSKLFPDSAEYFIVQVVSTISIHAAMLRKTEIRGKAAAFGLQANGDFYARFSDEMNQMLFEITPTFIFPFEVGEVASVYDSFKSSMREEEGQHIAIMASTTHSNQKSKLTDEDLEEYFLPLAREFAALTIFPYSSIQPADDFSTPTSFKFNE